MRRLITRSRGRALKLLRFLKSNLFRIEVDAYIVFRKEISKETSSSGERNGVHLEDGETLCVIDSDDDPRFSQLVDVYAKYIESNTDPTQISRDLIKLLGKGHVCYAAVTEDQIIAVQWFALPQSETWPRFTKFMPRDPHEVLWERAFVRTEFRGRHLQRRLLLDSLPHLVQHYRIAKIIAYAGVNNLASIKNVTRDFDEYGVLYHVPVTIAAVEFDFFPRRDFPPWRSLRSSN